MRMLIPVPDRDFDGYIFDCDGTLADTMPLHYRAWARVVAEVGGDFTRELFYRWGGRPSTEIVNSLNTDYGLRLDVAETVERKEAYFLELIHEVKPIEEVVSIARSIHKKGQPLAVCSGGYREFIEITLDAIGIKNLFSVIVCAEDYTKGKPAPDCFLTTAERLGIPPRECLVFEDSPAGIAAARAAGMTCVVVPAPST